MPLMPNVFERFSSTRSAAVSGDVAHSPEPPIAHPAWLPWAQVGVGLHFLLSLLVFAVGTPVFYAVLTMPCEANCLYFLQLRPAEVDYLTALGWSLPQYAYYQIAQEILYLFTFSAVGLVIYLKLVRQRSAQSWFGLLTTLALLAVGTILMAETAMSAKHLGINWNRLYDSLKATGYVAFMCFTFTFPDGRLRPRWLRWVIAAMLLWMVVWVVPTWTALDPSEPVGIYFSLLFLALMLGVQIYRYRHLANAIQRQQTKWFVFGFGIVFLAVLLWSALFVMLPLPPGPSRLVANLAGQGLLALLPVAFAVCIGISLLRYRLWDIDILINRTLVYVALTTLVVGLYALMVAGIGRLFHSQNNLAISLLATGVIAVLFQPAREWLQRLTNRWLFGERDDPAGVLTRLTTQLVGENSGDSLLNSLVETIAISLKLPYVALDLFETDSASAVAVQTGRKAEQVETLPLMHQQEHIGQLVVAPRSPGEALSAADQQLLAAIARLTATTARTIQLTDEVQEARVRTVSAREEERRRLRRDLHDGLGPVLAGQGLKLAAARQLLHAKPDVAAQLLDEVMSQSENTVAEVRRLVYALRPPTLDEFGLVGAIREHVETVGAGTQLAITVDAPTAMPEIPAAIEVAAFRIVQEALNNVLRHAQAHHCEIIIEFDGALRISIRDDGIGLPTANKSGVGLYSMRERAAEVGGSCEISNGAAGGVTVHLVLPLGVLPLSTGEQT